MLPRPREPAHHSAHRHLELVGDFAVRCFLKVKHQHHHSEGLWERLEGSPQVLFVDLGEPRLGRLFVPRQLVEIELPVAGPFGPPPSLTLIKPTSQNRIQPSAGGCGRPNLMKLLLGHEEDLLQMQTKLAP